MADLAACGQECIWHGLYRRDYDLATPESMSHPAKASWDLAFRILEHLKELGLADPAQSTILDPMAGTGRFCIAACAQGYRAVAIELEPKFVAMMEANKEYAGKKLGRELDWQIIQGDARRQRYGDTPGQIGQLPDKPIIGLTSPPYADTFSPREGGEIKPEWGKYREKRGKDLAYNPDNPANIGNLPDRPLTAITSPPYEDSDNRKVGTALFTEHGKRRFNESWQNGYGQSEGQIGQEQGNTYLSAMRQVYAEIAKVADVLVIVVKNPTRNGKLRRLDLDTIALLEVTGWRIHCQHQAMLFEEQEQGHLFEGSQKQAKGRMSFFKRLAWRKGSPVAKWEDVIVVVKE